MRHFPVTRGWTILFSCKMAILLQLFLKDLRALMIILFSED